MDLSFLQHSIFLSALGGAILNSFWQGCILYIIYETIQALYNNISARIKHNVSLLLVFCSFMWFIGTFVSKLFLPAKTLAAISVARNLETVTGDTLSPVRKFFLYADSILPYLSAAYILLLIFLMIKLFLAYGNVYFISNKNLINAPSHLEIFSLKAATQIGISRKIKIWLSHHVEVPATIGFIKPIILIPFASINNLTVSQLEAIVLHELSHIKRNDYLKNLVITVIETILFFNPFIVLFIKIIKRERENCCDDFVLKYQYDAHSYATALLQLEQSRKNHVQFVLGAVSGKKQLLCRIKRIMGTENSTSFNYSYKVLTLLVITLLLLLFSFAYILPSFKKSEREKTPLAKNEIPIPHIPQEVEAASQNEILIGTNNIETEGSGVTKKQVDIKEQEKNADDIISREAEVAAPSPSQELSVLPRNHNTHVITFENIPNISLENLNVNIDYHQINKAIQQAYLEINTIDWEKVQTDIHKSLSNMRMEELSKEAQDEIKLAIKTIPKLGIDNEKLNALKLVQKMQMQKMIQDSLRMAGAALANQRGSRLAIGQFERLRTVFEDSASGFSFSFNGRLLKINHLKLTKSISSLGNN